MPIGHEGADWKASYLPLEHVLERCGANGWQAVPLTDKQVLKGNGPAENYKIPGAVGAFGLIHPVSDHFCASCNRLRLTADGHIKPCLYWDEEFNIRRALGNEEQLEQMIYRALDAKPETHEMALALAGEDRSHAPTTRRMSQIGG
jgi:cyclic pyranopterin phosphate synthase